MNVLRIAYEAIADEVEIIAEHDHEYIHKQFVNDSGGVSICAMDNLVWLSWEDVPKLIESLAKAMKDHDEKARP